MRKAKPEFYTEHSVGQVLKQVNHGRCFAMQCPECKEVRKIEIRDAGRHYIWWDAYHRDGTSEEARCKRCAGILTEGTDDPFRKEDEK